MRLGIVQLWWLRMLTTHSMMGEWVPLAPTRRGTPQRPLRTLLARGLISLRREMREDWMEAEGAWVRSGSPRMLVRVNEKGRGAIYRHDRDGSCGEGG